MADLKFAKKLILEPLVKVNIVEQLIGSQSHCIVHCEQKNNVKSQEIVVLKGSSFLDIVTYIKLGAKMRSHKK